MQFSEKNAQPDKFGLAHCILIIFLRKGKPGLTPRTEKVRGRRPGDGGDDPKGITALMGKLVPRGARVNLINLERTHGTS